MSDFTTVELGSPQRQSLWAVFFLAFRTLRSVGVVQLLLFVGFVVARLPSVLAAIGLAAIIGLVLFVVATLRWWRYTFQIDQGELVVRRGVLQQQRLSIPLGRVQSVTLEQKLLHRVVSLVQISLDTAGTDTAEFVIDAVDSDVARTLQQAVALHRGAPVGATNGDAEYEAAPPAPPEQILLKHSPSRIVQIALAQSPFAGLVLIAPLFALGDELASAIPFDLPRIDEPTGAAWLLWFIPLVLVAGLVVSLILNLARVVLTDWNLTLRSTEAGLRRDAGLISTSSVASPLPRIQILRTRQGLVEKWWSLHRVDLATIGEAKLTIPGCSTEQMAMIRTLVLYGSDGVVRLDQPVSRAEVFLKTRNTAVGALLLAVPAAFLVRWWSLLALVPVGYVAVTVRRRVRLRRWALAGDAVAVQNEFVGWQRQEALLRKANSVTVEQRLFERSRDLATVKVSTAAGDVSIGMIPLAQAKALRDDVLYAVETDRRPWM